MAIPVPQGFHTITPQLTIKGAANAIEFYKKAFNAELVMKMEGPGGAIAHAEMKIGDSMVFINDEFPQSPVQSPQTLGGTTGGLHIYAPDVDGWYQRAVGAGAKSTMAPADMFWGDRMAQVIDPFGYVWGISSHIEDLTEEEISVRSQAFWKSFAAQ
ncbi:MAG TPA: VOC family protein [Clostridia bacterium]|nr:VOC family protein [Clostridia bacterium]